ncbi:PHD finger protein 21A isoform X4 [Silurus meridionalis]|nr:PHD finger protein 21A isoform X4 [Silurus meridionalis]
MGSGAAVLFLQKKVVEQLRRDLLVKQESAEIRLQTHTQLPLQADVKTTTLISNQNQSSLPPTHLNTPQNSVSVTPVIATKTLPLMLRAATPTTPIAMMPTPTIAMVTTLTNTPRPNLPNSDLQNSSIGHQSASKPANQGTEPVRIVPKNTIVLYCVVNLCGTADVLPHNIINLSLSLSSTKPLEQVMPKTSVASAALQPILASSQQPVLLTAKLSSALLPSAGPVHQLHIFNPQPGTANATPGPTNATQPCPGSAQPGFNIIQPCPSITMTLSTNISQFTTSSTKHNTQLPSILISPQPPSKVHAVSPAPPNTDSANTASTHHKPQARETCPNTPKYYVSQDVQQLLTQQMFDAGGDDVYFVSLVQTPDAVDRVETKTSTSSSAPCPLPVKSPPSTTSSSHTPSHTHTPITTHTPTAKRPDNPLKLAFMLSLGLVTHDYLEEIQSKRQERKRRTTANPVYSGAVFEPERKKSTASYLNSAHEDYSKRGGPPNPGSVVEWGIGPLTPTSLHPACVGPHFPVFPQSLSSHPSPSSPRLSLSSVGDSHNFQMLKKDEVIEWPGTLAIVHSYISYKAEREQEKQRLEKWSSELQQERDELELKAKELNDSITICTESRNGVLARQKEMEASIEKVKDLVRLIRGIQLPCLPQLLAMSITNGNPGIILTQQPISTPSSEEPQHPNRKNSTSLSSLSDVGNMFTDHRDTSDLHHNPIITNSSISSAEKNEDASETKNTSISQHAPVTNTSLTLSNTHSQNTMCASSNGTLEPNDGYEESENQNRDQGCTGDINKNSIRDLRGSVEPPLPTVMPIAEVVQGIE